MSCFEYVCSVRFIKSPNQVGGFSVYDEIIKNAKTSYEEEKLLTGKSAQ